jgi:hypothetical protein
LFLNFAHQPVKLTRSVRISAAVSADMGIGLAMKLLRRRCEFKTVSQRCLSCAGQPRSTSSAAALSLAESPCPVERSESHIPVSEGLGIAGIDTGRKEDNCEVIRRRAIGACTPTLPGRLSVPRFCGPFFPTFFAAAGTQPAHGSELQDQPYLGIPTRPFLAKYPILSVESRTRLTITRENLQEQ